MPTKLNREDDIDSAYDYSPTARSLSDSEKATSGSYADAGIDQAEAFANDPANASDEVRDRETNASDDNGGWTVNRTPGGGPVKQGNSAIKILKKGGPAGAILGILLALAGLVSFFGGPGLLIVQIAETITNKFDSQIASMDDRKVKILRAKLDLTTNGRCAGLVTIRCKYTTFSKHDIEAFKSAGIEVVSDGKSISGRTKATALRFTDPDTGKVRDITAKDFDTALRSDGAFRNATIKAYNTRYNSKRDKPAMDSLRKSKTSYADPFDESDNTDEKRDAKITETTKEGQSIDKRVPFTETEGWGPDCTKEKNQKVAAANELASDAEKVARDGIKSAQPSGFKTAVSAVNTFGALDDVCTIPTLITAIGTGAKVIRSQQEIRYAMFFLTTASMIKAGKANAADVSHLGDILTRITKDANGNLTKSATDSISYRYAAFGDKGSTNSSTLYKVGGGLGGDLNGLASKMYSVVGGKKTCDIVGNPWAQGAGVIISFIPGFGQAVKAGSVAMKAAVKAAAMQITKIAVGAVAMNQIINYLTQIATDMVAGVVVDANTYGEQSGDALVTGGAEFLTQTSGMGGNLPLTPDQAVAYNDEQDRVLAMYNAYDQATLSPFDTSSNATFLGSISSQLVPYLANMTSIGGTLSSIAAIPLTTFGNLTHSTTARADSADDYKQCEDYEYREINVATTPMCNVLRGIPAKYLALDPTSLTDELIQSGDIDEMTGDPKSEAYTDFVQSCLSGEPLKSDSDCMFTGSNADRNGKFAVHYVDQRNIDVFENGLPDPSNQQASSDSSQTATGGYALPVDQKWYDENPVWFSKPHHDYPAADIPVPLGTPVYAITSGRVTAAPNENGYGEGVTIMGDDGIQYDYGHGSDGGKIVKTGDNVKAGQLIMHSASTGNSTGPHLHVGMKLNGVKLCPQSLLVALGKHESTLPAVKSLPTSGCSN